jgi:copper chaperone CopZ
MTIEKKTKNFLGVKDIMVNVVSNTANIDYDEKIFDL